VELAWYEGQLAQAFPGSTEHERDWQVSLVRGHARIHAQALLRGEPQIWPDPRLSAIGRHLMKVGQMVREIREGGIECDL
jgi:hypothetical protein